MAGIGPSGMDSEFDLVRSTVRTSRDRFVYFSENFRVKATEKEDVLYKRRVWVVRKIVRRNDTAITVRRQSAIPTHADGRILIRNPPVFRYSSHFLFSSYDDVRPPGVLR